MPPAFVTTNLAMDRLLSRKSNGTPVVKFALKLRDHEVPILAAYGKKTEEEVLEMAFEMAYRVRMIFMENRVGKKGVNTGSKEKEVKALAEEVAQQYQDKLAKKGVSREEGEEEDREVKKD
ncbi:unnamed protein product [Zymoseptoria tritici ST99CH_3D1]|nr:unnamed protein product [Zymoseptoria tritici ST99CH_3D1]